MNPMLEEITQTILCSRCGLQEVSTEGDMCLECYQELIDEGWARWWERQAKEK